MENDDDQRDDFANNGGEALNLDGDFNDSDMGNDDQVRGVPKDDEVKAAGSGGKVDGQKLDNQPYDLAVDVNDSEEIESDEEDDEVNPMGGSAAPGQEP
jgi:hypothetical protein